jgi:hypothetical protein
LTCRYSLKAIDERIKRGEIPEDGEFADEE